MSDNHRFVKLSHLVELGQEILMRVDMENGEVCQFLEKFEDGEWHAVGGITSGIPISFDIVELVAKRKLMHELTVTVTRWDENNQKVVTVEPMSEEMKQEFKPELIVVVDSPAGPQQLKYERVEPPDCDDIKLFGKSTLANGYYMVDDETGEIDTTPKADEPQTH